MKKSIKFITPRFSTYRMFADYMRKFYVPAARKWQDLNDDNMARAKALAKWNSSLKNEWSNLSIRDVQVQIAGSNGDGQIRPNDTRLKVGTKLQVRALVELGRLAADDVSVELYNGPVDAWGNIPEGSPVVMQHEGGSEQRGGAHWFTTDLACERSGNMGMVVRVLPQNADLASSWEPGLILWEGQVAKRS
jgi:starch phosphorylase